MPTPKPWEAPGLKLSTEVPESVEEDISMVPGQEDFVNPGIAEQYHERLKIVRAEMVSVPGLREVTEMALERVTFFYYKMRDLEKSGALTPKTVAKMKLWFGVYEKIMTGWVKINDELYRQARQIDHDLAFKQSFISQVSAVLKEHLCDVGAERMKAITAALAKLAV